MNQRAIVIAYVALVMSCVLFYAMCWVYFGYFDWWVDESNFVAIGIPMLVVEFLLGVVGVIVVLNQLVNKNINYAMFACVSAVWLQFVYMSGWL